MAKMKILSHKKAFRTISLLVLANIGLVMSLYAQSSNKKGILYSSSTALAGQWYTNGWSANLEFTNILDLHKKNFWQIEVSHLKHPKEVKQTLDLGYTPYGLNAPRPFVFGKENYFNCLNVSYGQMRMIGQRATKSGVEVSVKYCGGFSLGILNPYYLQLIIPIDKDRAYIEDKKYTDEPDLFLNSFSIYGSSGFARGVNQIKLLPGIHAKAGLHFDWAFFEEYIKAIEVGIAVDAYSRKVPLMIIENNQQVFTNLYIGLQLGKKKS
jgi:hypothetical protein